VKIIFRITPCKVFFDETLPIGHTNEWDLQLRDILDYCILVNVQKLVNYLRAYLIIFFTHTFGSTVVNQLDVTSRKGYNEVVR